MAHFAEIDGDGMVLRVLAVPDQQENRGQDYLADDLGLSGTWVQTSYNTRAGQHLGGGQPLRKNFAGRGFKYDVGRDAFIPPAPYPSWVLDEDTCTWAAPTPHPGDDGHYIWNEAAGTWDEV